MILGQGVPKDLGVGQGSTGAPSHSICVKERFLAKGGFEVPVEEMLLDLLQECGKTGLEVGCESVSKDI